MPVILDVVMGIDELEIRDAMALPSTKGALYLYCSFTDPVYGLLTFYIGDQRLIATNVQGGPPVYPAISNWGAIRASLLDGNSVSDISIEFVANAIVHPSNAANLRFHVYELFQKTVIRDVACSIYQWNASSSSQILIWSGFFGGVLDMSRQDGVQTMTVQARSEPRASRVILGQTIDIATYPNAPTDSLGRMIDRAYGTMKTTLPLFTGNRGLHPVCLGYPLQGVSGIVTDQTPGGTATFTRFLFSLGDGAAQASDTPTLELLEPGAGNPYAGDLFTYFREINAYGVLSSTTVSSTTSDSTSMRFDLNNSPLVYVFIKPSRILQVPAAQNGNALIDDDPNTYVDMANLNDTILAEMPGLSLASTVIDSVSFCFDVDALAQVDCGIWNPNEAGGANWWGGAAKHYNPALANRQQIFLMWNATTKYTQTDAATSAGGSSQSQFQNGRFVGIIGGGNGTEVPVQAKIVRSGGGGYLHIYGLCFVVKLRYPLVQTGQRPYTHYTQISPTQWKIQPVDPNANKLTERITGGGTPIYGSSSDNPGLDPIVQLGWQQDDGVGTWTGTAGATIKKVPDIIAHMLGKVAGLAINTNISHLGNFIDARQESVTDEKIATCAFGHDPLNAVDAVAQITDRWPVRVFEDQGIWQYVGDDMNPHQSRLYRNSGELIRISAKQHLVDGDIRVQEDDVRDLVNRVILNYGNAYGSNKPQATLQYDNEVSQKYFPVSVPQTVDEPWITKSDLSAGHPAGATFLANWYGRRAALPRLTIRVTLSQAFYDLRRGHVLEFDKDMESEGIFCPAWRCGKPLHAFVKINGAVLDYADNTAPHLMNNASTSTTVWCLGQQAAALTLSIVTPNGYTTVPNAWKYYDGNTWTPFTNVTASDGGAPESVIQRSGKITISFDRPTPTLWKKAVLTVNGVTYGPGYWMGMDYSTSIGTATGNAETVYPATWYGRLFEVLEVTRQPGGVGKYPMVLATLREIM